MVTRGGLALSVVVEKNCIITHTHHHVSILPHLRLSRLKNLPWHPFAAHQTFMLRPGRLLHVPQCSVALWLKSVWLPWQPGWSNTPMMAAVPMSSRGIKRPPRTLEARDVNRTADVEKRILNGDWSSCVGVTVRSRLMACEKSCGMKQEVLFCSRDVL